ncbi:MAG: hypothetical protein IJD04_09015 [Desulfovibrionaceae bacterium]|nr:hypothetical protein [Desulfovibrionaceae bacterium]
MRKVLFILGLSVFLLVCPPLPGANSSEGNETSVSAEPGDMFAPHQPGVSGEPAVCHAPEFQEDASYDFRRVRWGMSPEEVEAVMGRRPTRHDTNRKTGVYRMGYKDEDLFGIKIWTMYSFINEKLWGAGYAKNYAEAGEFEKIAAVALECYGRVEPLVEGRNTEYKWERGDTVISLRLADDPRMGNRILFNFISRKLLPSQ